MKTIKLIFTLIYCLTLVGCSSKKSQTLTILQFNIWQEGTVIKNGYNAVIDEIINSNADLIALSEVRNYNNTNLNERIVASLKEKGYTFYSEKSEDSGILSKYPILEQTQIFPLKNDHGSITKAIINVNGTEIAFYSGHLDYLNCALYLPRGYHGSTWKKLEEPITNIKEIEKVNLQSQRDDAINNFIKDAKNEIKKGRIVIYGGDNNEPSHLDWTTATKDLYDHNGVVMPWNVSIEIEKNGFVDTYRKVYPNPVTHPGFTYPANNEAINIEKLAWSPDADDRDRIDFIYYYPDARIQLNTSKVFGPKGDISKNKRVLEKTKDVFLEPLAIWPTDHKGVISEFTLFLN
ncbi:endonuclease/exonuclease/phosphatase family protein [Lutibacter sp. A80]|uniref:endonuclease/exonuclease/phosphatase family protein n=1 Tax=Lutibacter sp. A80 TaxID=2918453 RepID=UPI001F053A2B|nr:endonuclease/exonuclease/phosphatase family protein [Lutibacter sp. A80]UMB61563.1 endonuclease/exonuclease/phosphatase family protein [Lutibacter sp. A80]